VNVRIPSPLRSYTNQVSVVSGQGNSLSEVLDSLDIQFPGIRFRVVDEQNRIRKHMRIFIGQELIRDLQTAVTEADEITLLQALSGG
jgi:sulfur-carrier protein